MANIINTAGFFILNIVMLVLLYKYMARMKNPMNTNRYLSLEGVEMFFIVLISTSTLALSAGGNGTTGFNLQAIRLLLLEILLLLSIFQVSRKAHWGPGTIAYVVYILWLVYSLTYTEAGVYGVRYILKYIYPLIIMLAGSAIVRDEEVFVSICIWLRRISLLSTIVFFIPTFKWTILPGFFWYETALTIHYVTISCISLALFFFYGKDWKDLLLAVVFVFPTILEVHRTGLLAMFAGLAVFCFYKFKWISLPYIAGVLAIGVAIVFYVPSFHEKMFWKEGETGKTVTVSDLREGNISEDDIRNNGREAVWEMLETEFYEGHEVIGSGIGSCQKFLYENPDIVNQTHGDYVQMRCDTGNIGMILYIIVAAMVLIHCFIESVLPSNSNSIKCCAMIAAGGVAGCYFGMYSDNVVTYTMVTTGMPFAFYGIMLGLKAKQNDEQ